MRLMLIEDNRRLAELIRDGMVEQGFAVDHSSTLSDARKMLSAAHYDLVLLDLGLPDGDGIDLIRTLRNRKVTTPVLVITARDALGDRVLGLDSGADDYLVKPFDIAELGARCRALLRRPDGCLGTALQAGNVLLDTSTRQVRVGNVAIEMPPREVALLELLIRHFGQVVTRSAIEASLYALSADVTNNAVDAVISRLRRRLSEADVEVHTAHGIGYMLTAPRRSAGQARGH
jgi:DNA-binding response OmpR family regulator